MSLVDQLAGAIATFEGFFKTGSLAQRNNNPGNLRTWGNLPTSGGYAVFPTVEQGWAALRRQIELNISRGLNLLEFFGGKPDIYAGYAPASDANDPVGYALYVAGQVGIPVAVPLSKLVASASAATPAAGQGPLLPTSPESGAVDWVVLVALAVAAAGVVLLLVS